MNVREPLKEGEHGESSGAGVHNPFSSPQEKRHLNRVKRSLALQIWRRTLRSLIVTAFISTLSHGAGLYVVRNLEEIWFYLLACSLCASLSVFLVCIFRVLIGAQQAALMDSWGGASQGTSEVVQPRVDRLDLPTQKEAETLSVDIPKDQVLNAVRQPRI